jgi:hypothetical protein
VPFCPCTQHVADSAALRLLCQRGFHSSAFAANGAGSADRLSRIRDLVAECLPLFSSAMTDENGVLSAWGCVWER